MLLLKILIIFFFACFLIYQLFPFFVFADAHLLWCILFLLAGCNVVYIKYFIFVRHILLDILEVGLDDP